MLARLYRSERTQYGLGRDMAHGSRPGNMFTSPLLARRSLQEHKDDMARVIVEIPPRRRSTGKLEGWTDRGTTGVAEHLDVMILHVRACEMALRTG